MEPFIAETLMFGGNFAPRSWAFCDGQLLPISQNTALFSLLGTTYGGDGRTTFALPDLRGRVAVHPGTGPGLNTYRWGEHGGSQTNTLTVANLPAHNHQASGAIATSAEPESNNPEESYIAPVTVEVRGQAADTAAFGNQANGKMADNSVRVTVGMAGGSQPVNNIQPFLAMNTVIALQGVFPSRN